MRIAVVVGVVLVLIGFVLLTYLVAVRMGWGNGYMMMAYATNEDSYKLGYKWGKIDWQTCQTPDGDCENARDACMGNPVVYINGVAHIEPPPDNLTACMSGWLKAYHK